jgi:hypothetical protein
MGKSFWKKELVTTDFFWRGAGFLQILTELFNFDL